MERAYPAVVSFEYRKRGPQAKDCGDWSLEVENNLQLNNQNANEDLVPATKGTEF